MEYLFAFLFFGVTLLVGGCGVVGWGRKSYLGPAEISFSSRDLNRRNKHDLFWLVASTGYFCILFLWAIVVSDFLPLEIHKHLVLPLSSITFTANSQADNHFYKYTISINLFIYFKYYTVWNQFFIKIHVKVFYIQVWFKCEIPPLFFLIKGTVTDKILCRKKKFFFWRPCKN